MARRKNTSTIGENPSKSNTKEFAPALSDDARMSQLASLAFDLVEARLRDGSASAQEVTTVLKLGSEKERSELELLKKQIELASAKTNAYKSSENIEKMYGEAIEAMRSYSGKGEA